MRARCYDTLLERCYDTGADCCYAGAMTPEKASPPSLSGAYCLENQEVRDVGCCTACIPVVAFAPLFAHWLTSGHAWEALEERQRHLERKVRDEAEQVGAAWVVAAIDGLIAEEIEEAFARGAMPLLTVDQVREVLEPFRPAAAKPCDDANSNVCVAEGCYGEACVTGEQ